MHLLSFATYLAIFRISTALSIPKNTTILHLPTFSSSAPPSPASLTAANPLPRADWPPTPWTYPDYPILTKFEEYGRHVSNSTLTKSVIASTISIQEELIRKDRPPLRPNHPFAFHSGIVTLYMVFATEAEITRNQVFLMLDHWRVYVGAFGAREIARGEMGVATPWRPAAAFAITFDRV
jgi:hypothetical protein